MRYIAILIAMVAVLALALIGFPGSGTPGGAAPADTGSSAPLRVSPQASQGNYSSAIQAAQNAVSQASTDAKQAASANP